VPRHTHPRPRRKHSRAHSRHQRDRYIARRWRQAKDRYGDEFMLSSRLTGGPGPVTDEDIRIRHLLRVVGHVLTMHPEDVQRLPWWVRRRYDFWPAGLDRGRFARNPFNTCGCMGCHWEKLMEPRRARVKRQWRRAADAEAERRLGTG
jgi:hypothetical protein